MWIASAHREREKLFGFFVPRLRREIIRFAHTEDRAYISEKAKSGCGGETKVV